MNRTLRIIGRARSDVDEIFNWLVKRSVRGAIAWYLAFRRAVADVAASPETYTEAPESSVLGRRISQALFKTRRGRLYRIVFEFSDAEVLLLRVRGPGQPPLQSRDAQSE